MTRYAWLALLAALCLAAAPQSALAQEDDAEDEGPEMVERTIKLPVRRYKVLGCGDVYRAAQMNRQVDVRFEDAMERRVDVPDGRRTMRVGDTRYVIAMALRTRCGLMLLVPLSQRAILEKLLGLPEDWPLNAQTLRQDLVVREGQKITVEGTVLGAVGGQKMVIVQGLYTEQADMPRGRREVQVFWPGAEEVESVARPGSQKFEFDCNHVADRKASVTVSVREMSREDLLKELALRQARLQVRPGQPADALSYGKFDAEAVYDQIRRGEPLLVEFTDTVHRTVGRLPDRLQAVPAVRYGRSVRLAVGAAFRTNERITCLVPANLPTPVAQVAGMVPGEEVLVRGQIIGEVNGEKIVRVDYLGFPDTEEADPYDSVWLATLEWPSEPRPRTLEAWDFGRYRLMDLPCLHRRGANEAVQMVLRQYRERTIEVPAELAQDEEGAEEE